MYQFNNPIKFAFKVFGLGIAFLASCNVRQVSEDKIDTLYSIDSKLSKSLKDTLRVTMYNGKERDFFEDEKAFSTFQNDSLIIRYYGRGWDGKGLTIIIYNDSFSINFMFAGCTHRDYYYTIEQKLKLNTNEFKVNKILVGDLFYKGLHLRDSLQGNMDTVVINGKFKLQLNNMAYKFSSYLPETKSKIFSY